MTSIRLHTVLTGAVLFGAVFQLGTVTAWARKSKAGPAVPAGGHDYHFRKKVDPGALQAELVANGFAVNYIDCALDDCTIHMPPTEKKDPATIVEKYVFVDPMAVRKQRVASMQALYDKWQAGTIGPADKDDLLKMLVQQQLGN